MPAPASTHSATKLLTDLRDHLARPDKPIGFLFGAGTSCSVKVPGSGDEEESGPLIPDLAGITKLCGQAVQGLGRDFASAWDQVCTETGSSVEDILSRVQMMRQVVGSNDKLRGLDRDNLGRLETTIRKTIAVAAMPDLEGVMGNLPHRKFAHWLIRTAREYAVEVFTLNYDIVLESALESERVPIFDGFIGCHQPFFVADSLSQKDLGPSKNWVRLWKMHGSVTWKRTKIDGRERVIRCNPTDTGEMIYPSYQKYQRSLEQPYAALADRLRRFLLLEDAILITCGYSFGDEHINDILFKALESKSRTHVFAIQYNDPEGNTDLLDFGSRHSNLVVVGPQQGVLNGRTGCWEISEQQAVPEIGFAVERVQTNSEGKAQKEKSPTAHGKVMIGDFGEFCEFLVSITSS